jgi:hypothetical protein
MKRLAIAVLALASLLTAQTASAHHSGAMFDGAKTLNITGTVKDFDWGNPHAWIHILAPGPDGQMVVWTIECSTINIIARKGWKPTSLKPGDKVTVSVRPARDGTTEGLILNVKLANGSVLYDHDY